MSEPVVLFIPFQRSHLFIAGKAHVLSEFESKILHHLIKHRERAVTIEELRDLLYPSEHKPEGWMWSVRNYIRRLRRLMKGSAIWIRSIYGTRRAVHLLDVVYSRHRGWQFAGPVHPLLEVHDDKAFCVGCGRPIE